MDIEKHVDYWRQSAREDWEVGENLVHEGKTRHGLFFLELALEKALKALVTIHTGEVPPRLHNVVRLAELAGLTLDDRQIDALADMNQFQIEGRYPDSLPSPPLQDEAEGFLKSALEIFQWLMNR